MPTKTVLFDFDGTLADTLPLTFKAFQAVFDKYDNRHVTEEQIIGMFGPPEHEIIAKNLWNTGAVEQAVRDFFDFYKSRHADEVQQNAEMVRLLDTLKELNIKMGVITGKSRRAYTISSEALHLSNYFEAAITGDDVEKPKPHPEGIWKALDILGSNKEEAVFLGDSNADIKAGKAAGLRTYGVQWLSTYQSSHFEAAPDAVFDKIDPFLELLEEDK